MVLHTKNVRKVYHSLTEWPKWLKTRNPKLSTGADPAGDGTRNGVGFGVILYSKEEHQDKV